MGVISWIIVGLIAGWLATRIMGRRGSILHNLAVGLIGAIFGGWLFAHLSIAVAPGLAGSLITATIGAIVFLVIWGAIRRA